MWKNDSVSASETVSSNKSRVLYVTADMTGWRTVQRGIVAASQLAVEHMHAPTQLL